MEHQSVLLKVTIASTNVAAVKSKRKAISAETPPKLSPLKSLDFSAVMAYASGFTFAKVLSRWVKLAIG